MLLKTQMMIRRGRSSRLTPNPTIDATPNTARNTNPAIMKEKSKARIRNPRPVTLYH